MIGAVSTHLERAAIEQIRLQGEVKEAGRLLGAAGFTEMPGARPDAQVAHRTVGDFYDLVMQFPDGHMEGIRQRLPAEDPAEQRQLWFPGGQQDPDTPLWIKSGSPLEVVHELLNLS